MKIQLVSDLHLEFDKLQIAGFGPGLRIQNAGADVLVLAGDICTVRDFESFKDFFIDCAYGFKHVIYIMGNHEHYKAKDFATNSNIIRESFLRLDLGNIHFLDNDCVYLDGVKFIGATLWTNNNNGCPITENAIFHGMTDYSLIKYKDDKGNYFKFMPRCARMEHARSVQFIANETDPKFFHADDTNVPMVVVTHHAPSFRSIHPKYDGDYHMNAAFASNLEDMMFDNIKLWCHGHTHTPFDYMVRNTRVVCNPYGYPGERQDITDVVVEV